MGNAVALGASFAAHALHESRRNQGEGSANPNQETNELNDSAPMSSSIPPREQWANCFSFPLPTHTLQGQDHPSLTYNLDVQFNGSTSLVIKNIGGTAAGGDGATPSSEQPAPILRYKGVNLRLGSENCEICAGNVLKVAAYIPGQSPSVWMVRAGQTELGVKEWLTLKFSDDGSEITKEGSQFQRKWEGALNLEGTREVTDEEEKAQKEAEIHQQSQEQAEARRGQMEACAERINAANMCPICYEDFHPEKLQKVITKCGHLYCVECIINVLQAEPPDYEGKCPMCRETVQMRDLVYVKDVVGTEDRVFNFAD